MILKYRIAEWKSSFWHKICIFAMRRSFFWFDYSYFYGLMYEWLSYSAKRMKEDSLLVLKDKKAREMLVASELCKRLATTYAAENAHITAFGETVEETYNDFDFHSKFSDRERKLVRKSMKIEKRDTEYYLEYLGTLLKKHSQGWWD
jgi:hypothetical protein